MKSYSPHDFPKSKMSKEPKIAREINSPLVGVAEVMKFQEALASCRLDGDTMDCEKCKAAQKQKLIEELQAWKVIDDEPVVKFIIPIEWWQQFERGTK